MTAPQIGIQTSHEEPTNGVSLVNVSGELDIYSLDEFKAVLDAAERSEASVLVLDLRELSFIDSSGLGAIIGLQGRAKKDSRRLVICPSEVVAKTFEATGLHRVLRTVTSPESIL